MAFGCSRWTTAPGWIFTAVEHGGTPPVCRLACLQARRPLRRPAADLHGACRAVWLDRDHGAPRAAGLADGSRLPVSVGPLHQPDQASLPGIQPSYAFVAEPQTNCVAERFNRHHGRNRSSMVAQGLPAYIEEHARTPSATSSNSTMPSGPCRKERLPEPRSQSHRTGVARRELNQARRVRQTYVAGTGCDDKMDGNPQYGTNN